MLSALVPVVVHGPGAVGHTEDKLVALAGIVAGLGTEGMSRGAVRHLVKIARHALPHPSNKENTGC